MKIKIKRHKKCVIKREREIKNYKNCVEAKQLKKRKENIQKKEMLKQIV